MIVSSHILNEVERLAPRVIVLINGRLAAAGGHHAIRDAMDDRPRHVLVRSDDGRRLASSLIALDSVGGVTFDAVRDGLVIETVARARAGDRAAAPRARRVGPPARSARARRLAREPVPGADPVSVSPSPTVPERTRRQRSRVRRDPRLHVAVVLPAQALGGDPRAVRGRAPVRAARPRRRAAPRSARSRRSPPTASSGS